jgi:hypothetical protein
MPFPTYSITNDTANGTVDPTVLHAAIVAAGPYSEEFHGVQEDPGGDEITLEFAGAIPAGEQTTVDGVVAAHNGPGTSLDVAKTAKFLAIDMRTQQLISEGFEWPESSGVYFSLSGNAQKKLLGMETARDEPEFLWPVKWNSIDDKNKTTLGTSLDARAFFLEAYLTVRGHLDSGTDLKDQVRDATTVAEVDAVVDNR